MRSASGRDQRLVEKPLQLRRALGVSPACRSYLPGTTDGGRGMPCGAASTCRRVGWRGRRPVPVGLCNGTRSGEHVWLIGASRVHGPFSWRRSSAILALTRIAAGFSRGELRPATTVRSRSAGSTSEQCPLLKVFPYIAKEIRDVRKPRMVCPMA